jgi:purine-binding chemotaxis protein CheW
VEATSQSRIIIIEVGDQFIGLWVDRVTEVLKVPLPLCRPPPEMILTIAGEYIVRVGGSEGSSRHFA